MVKVHEDKGSRPHRLLGCRSESDNRHDASSFLLSVVQFPSDCSALRSSWTVATECWSMSRQAHATKSIGGRVSLKIT
jgi:hypothetical protein